MRLICFVLVVLLVGCINRPTQLALHPKPMSSFVDDGSQKMKQCKFECKKEFTQCEIKANTDDSFYASRSVYYDDLTMSLHNANRDLKSQECQTDFENCFKDVCGGKVMVKQ